MNFQTNKLMLPCRDKALKFKLRMTGIPEAKERDDSQMKVKGKSTRAQKVGDFFKTALLRYTL